MLGSAAWAVALLGRSPDWLPWLRPTVLVLGVLGAGAVALAAVERFRGLAPLATAVSVAAVLVGPTAYSLQTVCAAHAGSLPTAGPAVVGGFGGPGPAGARGGVGPAGARGLPGGHRPPGTAGQRPGAAGARHWPGLPAGPGNATSTFPGFGGFARGGMGGLLEASEPSSQVTALLDQDAQAYTWVAATVGSQSAAGYQLATQDSVMPIGGFNGSDPSPTLREFQALVSSGSIHWFIAGERFGPQRGGSDQAAAIETG